MSGKPKVLAANVDRVFAVVAVGRAMSSVSAARTKEPCSTTRAKTRMQKSWSMDGLFKT